MPVEYRRALAEMAKHAGDADATGLKSSKSVCSTLRASIADMKHALRAPEIDTD